MSIRNFEHVIDNGRQFDNQDFKQFCANLYIRHWFTFVGHPQSNGEAEVTNRIILQGLRMKLDESKGKWTDELPRISWAYHTTLRTLTNETPFNLAFGTEAVIPDKIGLPTMRVKHFDKSSNSI